MNDANDMSDNELDRLLDAWNAPAPPPSLRDGLRGRFPRAERIGFPSPLRWALVITLASFALIAALAQTSDSYRDFPLVGILSRLYENFREGREAGRAASITARIRQSDPRVYVDGQLVAPLQYGPAATMDVQVPGEGVYSLTPYRFMQRQAADGRLTGWVEAGYMHDNAIEFEAGVKQVRIECNKPIVDSDRPVFAMRRP